MRNLAIIISTALIAGFLLRSETQQQTRPKWEYQLMEIPLGVEEKKPAVSTADFLLNRYGADGWELVSAERNGESILLALKRQSK